MNEIVQMLNKQSKKVKLMVVFYLVLSVLISLFDLKLNIFMLIKDLRMGKHIFYMVLLYLLNLGIIIRIYYLIGINSINSTHRINGFKFILLYIGFSIVFILVNGMVEWLASLILSMILSSPFTYFVYAIVFLLRIILMYVFLLMFLNCIFRYNKISHLKIIQFALNMKKQGIAFIVYAILKNVLLYYKTSSIMHNITSLDIFSTVTNTNNLIYIETIDNLLEAITRILLLLYGTYKVRQINNDRDKGTGDLSH